MKKITRRSFLQAAAVATVAGAFVACSSEEATSTATSTSTSTASTDTSSSEASSEASTASDLSGTLSLSGSSALYPLAEAAIDPYNELYPNVAIDLAKGGSGTGLSDVSTGMVDIGNSDVYAEEKLDAAAAAELVDHQVCIASMACVINPGVGITDITTEDLIKIFTCQVSNWSEVGGPDMDICLVTRPDSSGTRATFDAYALEGNDEVESPNGLVTDDSGELYATVKDTNGAIGYLSLSYLVAGYEGVEIVAIDGVEPTFENIYAGNYAPWCYEHMYTKGEASELAASFIDFMMSDEFAPNIEAMGYGVASKMTVSR
ncbi:MAG: phosphate ABC transporter substrate-binding protein [Faecalibacterium sp.]